MLISWCIIAQYAPFPVWYERDIFLPPLRFPKWRMLIFLQRMIFMGIHVEKTQELLLFYYFLSSVKIRKEKASGYNYQYYMIPATIWCRIHKEGDFNNVAPFSINMI